MNPGPDPHKLMIRLVGVVVGILWLMFYPSFSLAKSHPDSYQSDEDTVVSERDEKIDSFLGDLEKYADHPEKALEDLRVWSQEHNEEEKGKLEKSEKLTNEQVKVFFGGWMSFFVVVFALFMLKFGFNIINDSLIFLIATVKNFMPWLRTTGTDFMEKYLPPPETLSKDETTEESKTKQKSNPSTILKPE